MIEVLDQELLRQTHPKQGRFVCQFTKEGVLFLEFGPFFLEKQRHVHSQKPVLFAILEGFCEFSSRFQEKRLLGGGGCLG